MNNVIGRRETLRSRTRKNAQVSEEKNLDFNCSSGTITSVTSQRTRRTAAKVAFAKLIEDDKVPVKKLIVKPSPKRPNRRRNKVSQDVGDGDMESSQNVIEKSKKNAKAKAVPKSRIPIKTGISFIKSPESSLRARHVVISKILKTPDTVNPLQLGSGSVFRSLLNKITGSSRKEFSKPVPSSSHLDPTNINSTPLVHSGIKCSIVSDNLGSSFLSGKNTSTDVDLFSDAANVLCSAVSGDEIVQESSELITMSTSLSSMNSNENEAAFSGGKSKIIAPSENKGKFIKVSSPSKNEELLEVANELARNNKKLRRPKQMNHKKARCDSDEDDKENSCYETPTSLKLENENVTGKVDHSNLLSPSPPRAITHRRCAMM